MTRARDLANLIGSGNFTTETLTATAGQTAFTPSNTFTSNFLQVFYNGLLLDPTVDYTENGTTITLTVAATAGDEMEVVTYNTFSVGDAITQTEADNRYVNAAGDTMTGALGVAGEASASIPNGCLIDQTAGYLTRILNYSSTTGSALALYTGPSGSSTERMRIDSAGRVTMPYQPAFDAYDFTPRVGSGSIVWTNTRFNTGNHFNTSTGLFTAPVTGVYSFNFSILMQASQTVAYQRILFNINASRSTTFFDSLVGGSTGASGAFEGYTYIALTGAKTMKLNANDSVGLWNDSPHDTYSPGNYGHFSGYLIG